jgi:hypothetical protein
MYRASFTPSQSQIPAFYRQRMTIQSNLLSIQSFTDPSFILGIGVNVFLTRHFAIRPDIDAKIVRGNSQNYVVTALAVHLSYHFEQHPLPPGR